MTFIYHDVDLGEPFGALTVRFPLKQFGVSSILGFFAFAGTHYVVKLLRTRSLDRSEFGRRFTVPLVRRALRDLPMKRNPLSPTPAIIPVISNYVTICKRQLLNVNRAHVRSALRVGFPGTLQKLVIRSAWLDLVLPDEQSAIDLFPRRTSLAIAHVPSSKTVRTLAIIQEDMSKMPSGPEVYKLTLPITPARLTTSDAAFVVLCALAMEISKKYQFGLDLYPHVDSIPSRTMKFPNVLFRPDGGIVYVDTLGLFSPRGNIAEQIANYMLYNERGLIPVLTTKLLESFEERANVAHSC